MQLKIEHGEGVGAFKTVLEFKRKKEEYLNCLSFRFVSAMVPFQDIFEFPFFPVNTVVDVDGVMSVGVSIVKIYR